MPCLSLRLPPARNAWRSFTSKLQTRLHKKSKIPKIKTQRLCVRRKKAFNLCFALRRKKAGPVYVDKLFREVAIPRPQAKGGAVKVIEPAATEDGDTWQSESTAQMEGIDQRAEVFIAKFRAEMELQEKMAKDGW